MPTADDLKKQQKNADDMMKEAERAKADQKETLRRHGVEIDKQIAALREQKSKNDAELSKLG